MTSRKNYSFYMSDDFNDKLSIIQESNPKFKSLSKSQVLYFIISELADNATKSVEISESQHVETQV